jgi:endo-1,4-beta-D-glucanase Y
MKLVSLIRLVAVIIIVSALSATAYALFKSSSKADTEPVFASRSMLDGIWSNYKTSYWESSTGRTLDKQSDNITTSEGQSYTMLRAVWESDKTTFDKTWSWTQSHLQRSDELFSWKYGQESDGSYGILSAEGGNNTASDADSDIALALIMAASKWQQVSYLNEAKKIIPEIYKQEVIIVSGVPYLASDNLEKDSTTDAVLNVSYFAPYAYKAFQKLDSNDNWTGVVDSSYALINKTLDDKLDKASSDGLPPDWIFMNKQTGAISAPTVSGLTTNYGYDAMRTPWRLALDYEWNKDSRAKATLQRMSFLTDQWQANGKLDSIYAHDGSVVSTDEPPEAYGTALGYFTVVDPSDAKEIYTKKLESLYNTTTNMWTQPVSYYSDNWAWFGIALYDNALPNLTK